MKEKINLLYVDDEPLNLMLFEELFSEYYFVITAESGYKGLEMLNSNKEIKVVLSDMKMQGMNGLEFTKKASLKFPEIIYFILTGYDLTEEISLAVKNKLIIKCFHKPFIENEIKESIDKALKLK
jgi:two-component system response regulator (stage 0 sporulation protein F)